MFKVAARWARHSVCCFASEHTSFSGSGIVLRLIYFGALPLDLICVEIAKSSMLRHLELGK